MVVSLDCAAFKRDCGAEPQLIVDRPELLNHQQKCAGCSAFYHSLLALDVQLQTAFSISVAQNSLEEQLSRVTENAPEHSGAVIPFNASRIKARAKAAPKAAWYGAAAASIMLVSMLMVLPTKVNPIANVAVADDIIGHIYHEPELLTLTQTIVSEEKVQMVLKQANIELNTSNIKVLEARLCPFKDQLSAHLVIEGAEGPVTLLVLPGNQSGEKSGIIKTDEFNGRFLSAKHGNIAIVGNKKENIDQMSERVSDSIAWLN